MSEPTTTDTQIIQNTDSNNSENFTLSFGGKNDISANTYGALLVNTVILLEETNKELKTNAHLDIRVKSQRKGSFLVDLGIEPATLSAIIPLLTAENIKIVKEVASNIIDTASKVLEFWKNLKGEKPKEIEHKGENVIVVTGDNNTITVDKSVFNLALTNKRSQDAVTNTFKALKEDDGVSDFAYIDSDQHIKFLAEKEEFPQLVKNIPITVEETRKRAVTTILRVVRPSFDKALKSDYLYLGNRIPASNTDESFWEKVENGERFGKGDALKVVLEITQEYNKSLNAYENKSYTILMVESHTPRDEGVQDLFDDSEE
jgi:hypothetical protein